MVKQKVYVSNPQPLNEDYFQQIQQIVEQYNIFNIQKLTGQYLQDNQDIYMIISDDWKLLSHYPKTTRILIVQNNYMPHRQIANENIYVINNPNELREMIDFDMLLRNKNMRIGNA